MCPQTVGTAHAVEGAVPPAPGLEHVQKVQALGANNWFLAVPNSHCPLTSTLRLHLGGASVTPNSGQTAEALVISLCSGTCLDSERGEVNLFYKKKKKIPN